MWKLSEAMYSVLAMREPGARLIVCGGFISTEAMPEEDAVSVGCYEWAGYWVHKSIKPSEACELISRKQALEAWHQEMKRYGWEY